MGDWNRSFFTISYDWSRPPSNWAYLGNGNMGAFFDGTGINVCDYVVCKGIRRAADLAGLFWTYAQPALHQHRHVWQRITLDMYEGLLRTEEPTNNVKAWRKVTTLIHLKENLLIFHFDQHEAEHRPRMVGLSVHSRGGYPAKKGKVTRRTADGLEILDFPITGDIQPDPRLPDAKPNPAFRDVLFNASLAIGLAGDGRLFESDEGNIEVLLPRSGITTIYIAFDARMKEPPDAEGVVTRALREGYDRMLREHLAGWEQFWSHSALELPHEGLMKVYVASLYYLRTCAGSHSITDGLLPTGWWSTWYTDWATAHIHHGLITSNQVALAAGMVEYWNSLKNLGGEAMRARGGSGITLEGLLYEPEYYQSAPAPRSPEDFNGVLGIGLSTWRQYTHTGDRGSLTKNFEFIKRIADMLTTYAFVPHGDGLVLRKSRQVDDYWWDEGKENAFAPAVMGKAMLISAAEACDEMGDATSARLYREASDRIELPMRDGVYITFPGCPMEAFSNESTVCFFPAMIVPDREVAERTLDLFEKTCMSTKGLECFPTWTEHRAVFPFVHFRTMIGEVMLGRREHFCRLLDQVLANGCYASDFLLLPEYINREGGWHNLPGYLLTSGAFLQMVNLMLLYGDGDTVQVFPTVPEGWLEERIAFRLRAVPGVLVDLVSVPGQGVEMRIESARKIEMRVRKPACARQAEVSGFEFDEVEGNVRFEVPSGSSRARISWTGLPDK